MEVKIQISFQRLLAAVRMLPPTQRDMLKKELDKASVKSAESDDFVDFLLKGPVYNSEDIEKIEENRQSIASWRTKD